MRRRSVTASTLCTSSPSTRTVPAVGSISRLIRRSSVVLPEPDGPTMARNSRSRTSSETRSSTGAGAAVALGDVVERDARAPRLMRREYSRRHSTVTPLALIGPLQRAISPRDELRKYSGVRRSGAGISSPIGSKRSAHRGQVERLAERRAELAARSAPACPWRGTGPARSARRNRDPAPWRSGCPAAPASASGRWWRPP